MTTQTPDYLKLHVEDPAEAPLPDVEEEMELGRSAEVLAGLLAELEQSEYGPSSSQTESASSHEQGILESRGAALRQRDRQLSDVARRQRLQLPCAAPLVDGWDVAGWTSQADGVGGDFHDWILLPDGRMVVTVGDAHATSLDGALTATSLAASIRSHAQYPHDASEMLRRANHTFWTCSVGDQFASLLYAIVDPAVGKTTYALAGRVGALVLRPHGWDDISMETPPLGTDPEIRFEQYHQVLATGDVLVIFSDGVRRARDKRGRPVDDARIGQVLHKNYGASAKKMVQIVRRLLDSETPDRRADDHTVLIAKRS